MDAHRTVSENRMFAVTVGCLGYSDAEKVAALGTRSDYVPGHGGRHISQWLPASQLVQVAASDVQWLGEVLIPDETDGGLTLLWPQ